tara:strand:+ start:807 stop:980 length:174 start_codon:yes stop_codon:yes gene_type:complete
MATEFLLILNFSRNPLAFGNGKQSTKQPTSQLRNYLIFPDIFANGGIDMKSGSGPEG